MPSVCPTAQHPIATVGAHPVQGSITPRLCLVANKGWLRPLRLLQDAMSQRITSSKERTNDVL